MVILKDLPDKAFVSTLNCILNKKVMRKIIGLYIGMAIFRHTEIN